MTTPTEPKTPKRFSVKRAAAYVGAFCLAFLVTLYWSLPYDLVGQRILDLVQQQSGIRIQTASLSPYRLIGIEAQGVKVDVPPRIPGQHGISFSVDRITARLEPIDSLFGGLAVAFTAAAPEGRISGTVQEKKKGAVHLDASVDTLSLGKIPGLWDDLGVGFQGKVTGRVTGTVTNNDPRTLDGLADLHVKGAKFGGGMIHGFTVPGVDLGDVHLQVASDKGVVTFEPPLKIESKDLDARLSGTIHLRQIPVTSGMNLVLRFRPTTAFWQANSKLAGLAQAMLRNARDPGGFYAYRITGVLAQPRIFPKR